jgi:hypothetical protein
MQILFGRGIIPVEFLACRWFFMLQEWGVIPLMSRLKMNAAVIYCGGFRAG